MNGFFWLIVPEVLVCDLQTSGFEACVKAVYYGMNTWLCGTTHFIQEAIREETTMSENRHPLHVLLAQWFPPGSPPKDSTTYKDHQSRDLTFSKWISERHPWSKVLHSPMYLRFSSCSLFEPRFSFWLFEIHQLFLPLPLVTYCSSAFRSVALNLRIVTSLRVELPFHRGGILDILHI